MPEEKDFIARVTCRSCGSKNLAPVLSLGELYVSDFLDGRRVKDAKKAPLEIVLCGENGGCGLLQLRHTVSHESLYRNYWYRSGMNKTMTKELGDIAEKAEKMVSLKPGDFVLDIGSNDGTLLRSYKTKGVSLVGFEPAQNIVLKYGGEGIFKVFADFFNYEAWRKEFGNKKAKVITAIAMFYDLEDPNAFVADVKNCLDDDGIFIAQIAYLPYMLERNAFDGICHEHLEYYSLSSLENLLRRHGLEIFDAELRDINEGSIRVYVKRENGVSSLSPFPDSEKRLREIREKEAGLSEEGVYEDFVRRLEDVKKKTAEFINREVARGKKVYAYGASTKGNTLLQCFGLDDKLITAAAERNPDKWGKKTVGTDIPIISEEQARAEKPDYFLILPWHFLEEFREREKEFLKNGGKFIVPLPEFKII